MTILHWLQSLLLQDARTLLDLVHSQSQFAQFAEAIVTFLGAMCGIAWLRLREFNRLRPRKSIKRIIETNEQFAAQYRAAQRGK